MILTVHVNNNDHVISLGKGSFLQVLLRDDRTLTGRDGYSVPLRRFRHERTLTLHPNRCALNLLQIKISPTELFVPPFFLILDLGTTKIFPI